MRFGRSLTLPIFYPMHFCPTMMQRLSTFVLLFFLASIALAAEPTDVAATVNGAPITVGEITTLAEKKLAGVKNLEPALEARVQAEILQGMVDFRLLQAYFKDSPNRATDEQVGAAMESLRKQIVAKDPMMTLEKLATAAGQSSDQFREELLVKISINKEIGSTAKVADIEEFFNAHRAEFDGSELRVSHILLRPLQRATPQELQRLEAQAAAIREAILGGKLTFAAAVEKYSQGPSRVNGGDLGWIRRDGPMLDSFNRAAYQLRADDGSELSPPVITPFGIHLITRTGSKPGKKTLADVRAQVEQSFLLNRAGDLIKKLYREGKVEFTGKLPHYKLGTKELVLAEMK
jgi:parvulin-like peptidyl-prolyl isomerase